MPTLNLGRVGFVNKGAYIGGTTAYKINDIVVYNNTVYACIQAHNTSHLPTDTAYWQKWTGYGASGIANTPSGGIAATDVQSAINELDTEKQNIAPSYQGTQATNLASATTVNIGAATGDYLHITGTTTITAFDAVAAGVKRTVVFDGTLTLTHNATSLILPTGANITTTAKDVAVFVSEGSGNWRCTSYQYTSLSFIATTTDQTIAGIKTFSSSPIVPNASTATQAIAYGQAVKNTGDETVAGIKTFSSSPIVPTSPTTAGQVIPMGGIVEKTGVGIGYGTGSGGTVTQSTSKSTAVTLNKPTGAITMNNAALAAGTAVLFQLNNTIISATDSIIVNVKSGFATNATYRCWAEEITAGGCKIVLENRSGVSLSEAIVLSFAVIKGATA